MKRNGTLAVLAFALLGAAFEPKELIMVDLKDAKIVDVIQTLGTLAKLPVVIDPGIGGTMTLKLEGVPFERALELISQSQKIWVRVENGKLAASRIGESAAQALGLPFGLPDVPRLLLSEYREAISNPPPFWLRVGPPGKTQCYLPVFSEAEAGVVELIAGTVKGNVQLSVAQVIYDPVRKTRFLALESSDGWVRSLGSIGPGETWHQSWVDWGMLTVSSAPQEGDCERLRPRVAASRGQVMVQAEATIRDGPRQGELVMAPRIQVLFGTVFTVSGKLEGGNELLLGGYVSRDGTSAAVVFGAQALRTDPGDGREYYTSQFADAQVDGFLPLGKSGAVAAILAAGVASPDSLELKVSRAE